MKIYMGAEQAIEDIAKEEGIPAEAVVKQENIYTIQPWSGDEEAKSQVQDIFSSVKKGATDVVHFVDEARPEAESLVTKFGKMSTEGKIFTLGVLYFIAKKIF